MNEADMLVGLYDRAQALVLQVVGLVVKRTPSVALVDAENRQAHLTSPDWHGLYHSQANHIDLLKGLGVKESIGVLAHEYIHAWQEECCPVDVDTTLLEGFATWVQQRVLRALDHPSHRGMEKSRHRIYGSGLRKCLLLEASLGVEGLIDFVRTHRSFPMWLDLQEAVNTFLRAA